MKRPSFQFYVGDWQSNSNLRRCTFTEKGIWLDVMCLLHDGEQYGVLRWPLKEIAQAIGCKLLELKALVTKGVLKGADIGQKCEAFIYTPRSGGKEGEPVTLIPEQQGPIWYSSRMVKDDHVSKTRGKGTRFGEEKQTTKPSGEPQPSHRVGGDQSSDGVDCEKEGLAENCSSSQTTPENRVNQVSEYNSSISDQPTQRVSDGPSTSSSTSVSKKDPVDDYARVNKIFEWLQEFLNSSTPLFSSPVAAWLTWGADFQLDIKPVAERWRKANPKKAIRSLEWLDGDIAASIKKRLKTIPENNDNLGGSNANPQRRATIGGGNSGGRGASKTDLAKAAVMRAAVAGGYAPPGQPSETGVGDDAVSVFSRAEGMG